MLDNFFDTLPQVFCNGLTRGSIYALVALGFTVVYNTTDIINFAQGEFVMLGGMLAATLLAAAGLPLPLAVIAAVLLVTLVAALLERLVIHPLKSPSTINLIMITIGASIFLKGVASLIWGKDDFILPAYSGEAPLHFGGVLLVPQNLWVWGATLVAVILLQLFYARTVTGKALRACAHNPVAASLMGIDVKRMVLITFALSGGLGALAGVVITPIIFTNYQVGTLIGLKGFCAAIFGGVDSITGAVVGGLLIGVLESLFGTHVSSGYMDAFAFLVMLAMLFLRPQGIFGAASTERA